MTNRAGMTERNAGGNTSSTKMTSYALLLSNAQGRSAYFSKARISRSYSME